MRQQIKRGITGVVLALALAIGAVVSSGQLQTQAQHATPVQVADPGSTGSGNGG